MGAPERGARRILIADDSDCIRKLYERELAREGYEVMLAANGLDAVRIALEWRPQLVVMDIRLPGMDGIEALTRIVENDPGMGVVISTGYMSFKDDFRCWVADAFLLKSSDLTKLKSTVRGILETRGICDGER